MRALYLSEAGEHVFALFHPPAGGRAHDSAILICPPFGWEEVCSYRSRHEWAERLAGAGYPTLRLDLPSTGDSGGMPGAGDRVAAWRRAVRGAAFWLAESAPAREVTAIGIGLGGMLACTAISEGAPIGQAVLWAVPASGRALLRELRAFERLEASRFATREQRRAGPQPDVVRAGGFTLCAETVSDLKALELTALDLSPLAAAGRAGRVLLLERDGMAVDRRLREHLQRCGARGRALPGPGYGAMTDEPHHARAPERVFATVQSWLAEPSPSSPPRGSDSHRGENGGRRARRGGPRPAAAGAPPCEVAVAELEEDGVAIRERSLVIERDGARLFGVLSEAPDAGAGELAAVLLNAGAIRRIGPNRLWVEIARRWAARGVPVLRLDLEGLGDAEGDAARFADVAELYVPQFVAQVRVALDTLAETGVARSFALAGLCSGAYWAFHAALADERVAAAFMLNPRTLFWDASQETVRNIRRGLLKPSSWRMIMQGHVSLARVGQVVKRAPQSLLASALARAQGRGGASELELALDRLRDADRQLAFVFSDEEPLHEELVRGALLPNADRWPNVTLELIAGRDHTLRPPASQRGAHEALDRALERLAGVRSRLAGTPAIGRTA
jgi:alpha-beta hydrolase superfamily lysophospholipase